MNRFKSVLVVSMLVVLTACSGGGKKVLVMASGKITADANDPKKIKLEPGSSHNEKELVLSGGDESITVDNNGNSKSYDIKETGSYVLNLKPDTLVGGVIRYGASENSQHLDMDQLNHIIDSTKALMTGKNASDANKSYFIPPMSIKKISSNAEAALIGPYNSIPGSVQVDKEGNGPETYKFFTNKQKQESLDKLIKQMKE